HTISLSVPFYSIIPINLANGEKDVVSIRTLHLKNYLNLRESRLCLNLCVNMSLRKCTSLFSRRCYATFGSAVRCLIEAFHPAGVSVHFLRFIFYTLCWM